ncbi:glycoside hydrolase family 95-like protein [Bifidobacterium longum]|uniref:glycoside hydrolase family 95-like protein n=1 Tax=Bifidobacterium longum TaxID=216816 RepID=UPI002D21EE3B|nr:glycosyl hydrolase family 65 protein [Bifidobacterium longum]
MRPPAVPDRREPWIPGGLVGDACPKSHDGWIRVLPALPEDWHEGSFHALRARGGIQVDATWTDQTVEYTLRCSKPTEITLNVLGTDMGRVALSPDKPFKGTIRR